MTVRAGTTAKVRLVVESQKETIQGRVLDDAGNPVSDAFVEAEREDEGKQRGRVHASLRWGWGARTPVVTDNDGAFLLGGLARGAYGIRAYRKGGGEVLAEGVKTGTTTTLTILRTGTIAGNVLDANGKPPADFTVTVRDTKRLFNRVETFFRTEGTFTVSDLPAGDFTVTATTAAGRALGETSLAQGERKDGIKLVVEASGTVSGRLVALDDGAPVAGMYVIAFPAKGGGANNAMAMEEKLVSDADGRFRVERVAPGPTRLITFPRGPRDSAFASAIAKVDVPAGGAIELPPIKVARNRLVGGVPGDLGFTTEAGAYGQDPSTVSHGKVVAVRAGSSAAKAGLVAGDEVTSVDGYSVEGDSGYLYDPLTTVAPGTKLALGLRRGGTVAVTAASPAAK